MKLLTAIKSRTLDAGPKAPLDIVKILEDSCKSDIIVNDSNKVSWKIKKTLIIIRNIFSKERLIIQHPITQSKLIRLLNKDSIVFVHDLNSIRNDFDLKVKNEIGNINHFNYIICHNKKMKDYLIEQKISEEKLYVNELFDYLCKDTNITSNSFNGIIVYAGNAKKSPFINQLDEKQLKYSINIYGQGIEHDINKKVKYKGSFQPEDLPKEWDGSIGLVWDGNYDESDQNEGFKNYTKYNNPHKLSCYIAAGIPVIVWKHAAIADFVLKNNIGYVISNIYDINNLNFSNYAEKKKNIDIISDKVKKGYYTKKVINSILKKIK